MSEYGADWDATSERDTVTSMHLAGVRGKAELSSVSLCDKRQVLHDCVYPIVEIGTNENTITGSSRRSRETLTRSGRAQVHWFTGSELQEARLSKRPGWAAVGSHNSHAEGHSTHNCSATGVAILTQDGESDSAVLVPDGASVSSNAGPRVLAHHLTPLV